MGKKGDKSVFRITQYQPDCVTSSSIMVEVSDVKLLFDLGMQQEGGLRFPQLYHGACQKIQSIPFSELTHVILAHSHYDHVGLAPILARHDLGFHGEVISTELTMDNARLIMFDAERINQSEVAKHGGSKNGFYPYYDKTHVQDLLDMTKCYGYNQVIKLSDTVDLTLLSACHLAGASMCLLTYHGEDRDHTLLYTSDITYGHTIERPFTMRIDDKKLKVDVLIMESTYGLREDKKPSNAVDNPMDFLERIIIEEVVGKNQTLWIPSFAVGRATTLYYYLNKIFDRNKEISDAHIPVYFCGQMMYEAHKNIGKKHFAEYYDEQWREERDIFEQERFNFLTTKQDVEHFCLNNGRKIVISSSGMYDKGFSEILAPSYVPNKKVSCCSCGYQSEGTLGYEISNGASYAQVKGAKTKVRLNYCGTIPCLSGHASHKGLLSFVKEKFVQSRLKDIILVHGDTQAKIELKEDLEEIISKDKKIHIIRQYETLKL